MSVRIIGGKFRGMRIEAPDSARPTLVRHRQLIFDTLESIEKDNFGGFFKDKVVIDCFAGSGALGIESISRGAKQAYMIDQNHQAVELLHNNTASISEFFTIIRADIMKLKNTKDVHCDLAFLDPPYGKVQINKVLEYLKKSEWINENTWIVVEEDKQLRTNLNCNVYIEKNTGNSVFSFGKIK